MILPSIENTDRPDPIPERVGSGMFTDREQEMASLMEWVDLVAQKVGRSRALVSHRRYGKTAIMERLYNRLFWERDDVMPFYFELGEDKLWIKNLVRDYLHTFLQQFLAYRLREAQLAFKPRVSFKQLYAIAEKVDEIIVLESLDYWEEVQDSRYLTDITKVLHEFPHSFAVETGLSIIVMFDEFQRLDQLLYYDEALTRKYDRYTGSFATAAESSRAPMLIAGSQVTVLTQQALTGAMLGRVGPKYIKRLSISGGAELVLKFAQRQNLNISLDLAYTISRLVDGHPYYIWCLFNSENLDKDLTTEEGVQKTLTFEIENHLGYINEFWRHHFAQNMAAFNLPYARQMIFYLAQYPDSEVRVEKLAEDLALPLSLEETNETLRKLIWCDLIREKGYQFYGGLSDPQLARMLRIEYSWEIEQLTRAESVDQVQAEVGQDIIAAKDEIIVQLKGELRNWVGRFAEMFIEKIMKRHFKNQRVEGAGYFNHPSEILLPRFERVFSTMTQPEGATRPYQIDLYGVPVQDDALPWAVEVKNWQDPVTKPEVEHFWEATQTLAADKGHTQMVCWFYARSGFSTPAQNFLDEKSILYTDQDGLVQLLRDFEVIERWHEA